MIALEAGKVNSSLVRSGQGWFAMGLSPYPLVNITESQLRRAKKKKKSKILEMKFNTMIS